MSIWTCKKAGLICLALLTSGCDIPEGDGGFNLFSGALGGLIDTAPLAQADMAGDQVKLTPALGYCVDPQNLASNFALIARCDTLGGEPDKTGAPLLIITAAVTRLSGDATLSEVLLGVGDGTVSRVGEIDGIVIGRVENTAPSDGLSDQHWRSVGRVGNHALALSLYGPENALPNQVLAADIITSTMESTRRASPQIVASAE